MSDIHQYSKRLEQALKRVSVSEKITEQDKKVTERFSTVLRTQRISIGRVAKYVNHLKIIGETLPVLTHSERGLGAATKEDLEQLSIYINESESYKPHTKSDYVTVLKRFYQWLKAPPDEVQPLEKEAPLPARSRRSEQRHEDESAFPPLRSPRR